jgi:hypothetical protein
MPLFVASVDSPGRGKEGAARFLGYRLFYYEKPFQEKFIYLLDNTKKGTVQEFFWSESSPLWLTIQYDHISVG